MIRMPSEKFNSPKYGEDEAIVMAWRWFISFISERDWLKRKSIIESKIAVEFKTTEPFSEPLTKGTIMLVKDDVIGWYLYLLDTYINEPHKYEFFQGARVIPIFERLGKDLDRLKSIDGIDKRVKSLLRKRRSEADALLFEILTALLWHRNGYDVAFIPEKNNEKSADLLATKNGKVWNIECKRQSKTSNYAYRETAKRQKMISYINKILIENNILLKIVFHVELDSLPDNFLQKLLVDKIKLAIPGKIVSNEQVDINLEYVDIPAIKRHLKNHFVKHNSPTLNMLIGKERVDNKGFTCGVYANFFRIGEGEVNNLYISDLQNAFGVYWSCDAKEAIWAKARDIKNQVYAAMQQFNSGTTGIIHIGMETFDGPDVEMARFEKINNTMNNLSPENTNLRWIFCTFFQAYSPPDQNWVFDETVSTLSPYFNVHPPLDTRLMVVPEDADIENNSSHWDRNLP
jgi:hypothetical protein